MPDKMNTPSLYGLPRVSEFPYRGTPGQGHPDESTINSFFANRHWTDFQGIDLITRFSDDVMLLKSNDLAILLPAFFIAAIQAECLGGELSDEILTSITFLFSDPASSRYKCIVQSIGEQYSENQKRELLLLIRVFNLVNGAVTHDESINEKEFSNSLF